MIKVNDYFSIGRVGLNLIVYEKIAYINKNKEQDYKTKKHYYSDIEQCFRGILDHSLKKQLSNKIDPASEMENVEQVIAAIQNIKKEIVQAIADHSTEIIVNQRVYKLDEFQKRREEQGGLK